MSAAEDVKVRPERSAGVVPGRRAATGGRSVGKSRAKQAQPHEACASVRVALPGAKGTGGEGQRRDGQEAREQKDQGSTPDQAALLVR